MQRGRRLSDSGAKTHPFHEVSEAHLGRIIQVDLKSELFTYAIDDAALARAQLMDGKLMLVTNVRNMAASEVVQRYKALADIERGFKVLKSEIEIAPVFHRLPERIQAHASICFMALILYRVIVVSSSRIKVGIRTSTLSGITMTSPAGTAAAARRKTYTTGWETSVLVVELY